jgi:phage replication initiation protein
MVRHWWVVRTWLEDQVVPKITRVDLAVDFLQGEYTVEHARDWLASGLFNCGGRNPRHSTPGDWLSPQPVHGRTLEIGRRENGKMLRVYEKGRQLGDPDSPWTRFEVEIRNNDRDIPLDVLSRPAEYFAGAYRALAPLVDAGSERVATHQKEGELSSRVMAAHARSQYGQFVHVLRASLTAGEVLDVLSRPGVPRRLERSSLVGLSVAALKRGLT